MNNNKNDELSDNDNFEIASLSELRDNDNEEY